MVEGLYEITLPQPVSYAPQTIGWVFVAVGVLAGVVWVVYRWHRYRQTNRYRSLALSELSELEEKLATSERNRALAMIPQLVKRVALEAYQRKDIASLSGKPWLEFLNSSYGGTGFTKGAGQLLPELSYSSPSELAAIGTEDVTELTTLLKKWFRKHQ